MSAAPDDFDAELDAITKAAVAEIGDAFIDEYLARLASLKLQCMAAIENDAAAPALLGAVFAMAHDVKGQGETFGYPLAAQIGGSLCRLTRARGPVNERALQIVLIHLNALEGVLQQKLAGDGGATGAELISRLDALVEPAMGHDRPDLPV